MHYLPIEMTKLSFIRKLEVQNPTGQENKPRETERPLWVA